MNPNIPLVNYEVEKGSELLQYGVFNRPFFKDRYNRGALSYYPFSRVLRKTLLGWGQSDIFNREFGLSNNGTQTWPHPDSYSGHMNFIKGASEQFNLKAALEIGLGVGLLPIIPPVGITFITHGVAVYIRERIALNSAVQKAESLKSQE